MKNHTKRITNGEAAVAGIDLGKKSSEVCLLDKDGVILEVSGESDEVGADGDPGLGKGDGFEGQIDRARGVVVAQVVGLRLQAVARHRYGHTFGPPSETIPWAGRSRYDASQTLLDHLFRSIELLKGRGMPRQVALSGPVRASDGRQSNGNLVRSGFPDIFPSRHLKPVCCERLGSRRCPCGSGCRKGSTNDS